jgi:alpha-tubulin suppressor-like RCC1 family protein
MKWHTFLDLGSNYIPLERIKKMAASDYPSSTINHSLMLLKNGDVYSTGRNDWGQLGRTSTNPTGNNTFVKIPALSNIIDISASAYNSLFLRKDGRVYSCGLNNYGQLGRNTSSSSNSVSYATMNLDLIPNLYNVKSVNISYGNTSNSASSYFLHYDGTVSSCGINNYGQLGRNIANGSYNTINLDKISLFEHLYGDKDRTIRRIVTGWGAVFFISESNKIYSCGLNNYGQLLDGTTTSGSATSTNLTSSPVEIELGDVVTDISFNHVNCIVMDEKYIYSCGYNAYGQLGRVTSDSTDYNLTRIPFFNNHQDIKKVCTDGYSLLVLKKNGQVYSCGYNVYGVLGDDRASGSYNSMNIALVNISDVVDMYFGGYAYSYAFFLLSNGKLIGTGNNSYGSLGTATAIYNYLVEVGNYPELL